MFNDRYTDSYNQIYLKFYEKLGTANFKTINIITLLKLKQLSTSFNNEFNNTYSGKSKNQKYFSIMDSIRIKRFNEIQGTSEEVAAMRYILFMFAIDPEFEAAIIFGECDNTKQIKNLMEKKFGMYDINLIKLEKFYLKRFASEKKRQSINEEIEKRAFK